MDSSAGLLVLIATFSAAKVRPDWSKLTFPNPGSRTVVGLYDKPAPATNRRIKPRFPVNFPKWRLRGP